MHFIDNEYLNSSEILGSPWRSSSRSLINPQNVSQKLRMATHKIKIPEVFENNRPRSIYQDSNMAPRLSYLTLFSLHPSLVWELRSKRNLKNLQFWPESFDFMLEYWYIEGGLFSMTFYLKLPLWEIVSIAFLIDAPFEIPREPDLKDVRAVIVSAHTVLCKLFMSQCQTTSSIRHGH